MIITRLYRATIESRESFSDLAALDSVYAINSVGEGASIPAMRVRLPISRSAVLYIMKDLTERGLLRREGKPKTFRYYLTEAGKDVLRKVYQM